MAHTVYLTGLKPGGGKSTVALGVTELLSRQVQRIGVFRPLIRTEPDPIVELLRRRYHLRVAGTGTTYAEAARLIGSGRVDDLISLIVERFWELDERCDAALVIGTDFGRENGAGQEQTDLPDELAVNIRLANEMRATTLPIIDGIGRTAEQVAEEIRTAYHVLTDLNATLVAIVANRVVPDGRPRALQRVGRLPVPVYAIPTVPTVYAPTVAQVADALAATPLLEGEGDYTRDALEFVVGGATVPTFLDYLVDGALVITPGDRADVIISAYAAHVAGQVSLAGLLLTLGKVPEPQVLTLLQQMGTPLPLISVPIDSFEAVSRVASLEGRIDAENPRKVQAALGAFESHVDTTELADRLNLTRSARITPMMFEYELISRARGLHRHVVLPEGTEERILRAAEILLRRKVCEITLLGPTEEIARRARELGLDVTGAQVVDPADSSWREEFAQAYLKLRGRKGVTMEYACDRISDVNYFGTMMVHTGRADAMVSGSVHPTANTIRPAFEIIKTLPGVSVASSVFFMCLPDRVLVYGDCAVNPEPTPEQLADIAISSAGTAAQFGIEPRVAMLSYSTGTSGSGADVEKVVAATTLARQRRPDLPVEGPIQYDAAIDPTVAATKLPGSAVAGRATVFIFPDLNTGNNTYKAVQRSANAVAIGPVLQGLRKPVNDLSRGATVRDIVNTVAITAIQAASGAGTAVMDEEVAAAVSTPTPEIAGGPDFGPDAVPDGTGGTDGAGGPDGTDGARRATRTGSGGTAVAS